MVIVASEARSVSAATRDARSGARAVAERARAVRSRGSIAWMAKNLRDFRGAGASAWPLQRAPFMRPLQSFGSLFVLASLALTLPLLGGCAVEADPSELTTVPSIEPIAVEGQRAKTLTCPAGSSLCKTVCCPTGSFCTILRDGTELCQVSPIDPKLSSVSSTSTDSTSTLEKTRDGGSTQPYLQIKLNDIFISSY